MLYPLVTEMFSSICEGLYSFLISSIKKSRSSDNAPAEEKNALQ